MKLLVIASTFPANDADPVPAFVKDQLIALKKLHADLQLSVLAPHDRRSATATFKHWPEYDEYRFHYFWPLAAEKLAGRGIMPALQANRLNYLLIPFLFLGEFVALLRLTRKLRPDVIYAHWFTPQAVVASWVSRITRTPFVFTTHASDVEVWRRIPLLGRQVVRSGTRGARAFTAVSRRSMERLQAFFSKDEWSDLRHKGTIIPMGVALPDIQSDESDRQLAPMMILFLGRLVEKKGLQYLLPAYSAVREKIGASLMVIGGEGPMLESLKRQAAELGLGDNVSFPGFVTGMRKSELLRRADIFVVPSIVTIKGDVEGLPVSLLEGLSYGKICIASAESGADDILTDGKDGFLVPQGQVEELSAALMRAAEMPPMVRLEMEIAARSLATQFDWGLLARRHYEFLLEMS